MGSKDWTNLLDKHVANFERNGSWSKSFLRLTRGAGPESPFVTSLAEMEASGATAAFTGKPREHMNDAELKALRPLAEKIMESVEAYSHGLFLCTFWAGVSERQGTDAFLQKNATRTCINASVAWAKVLMAHRTFHCNPNCEQETPDGAHAYVWNFNRTWEVSIDWFTSGVSLALSYDLLYDKMSEKERQVIRSAIALLVMKRWVWGTVDKTDRHAPNAETDPHRIYGNWGLYHSNLYLTNLAIEGESGFLPYAAQVLKENGETGFNAKLNRRFDAMIKAYMIHTIYPDGSTFEDGYTYFTAFREGSLGLVASHRRGTNVLGTARFRNTIHNAAQMFEPWQCGPLVGHSSGGGLSYPSFVGLFRYAYPEGPLSRMLWAQRFGKHFLNTDECRIYWTQTMTQLAFFGDEHAEPAEVVADSPETLSENVQSLFPQAYVSARRGLIISRASYSQRSSYMHLDARPDSFFLGHDNADRGVITFSALKRRWFDDLDWENNVDSRKHSLFHIDGLAEAQKAPSVTIMKVDNDDSVCISAADLTYAYNVQWARGWQGPNGPGTSGTLEYDADGSSHETVYKFPEAEDNSPWDLGWPMEDNANELGFNRTMSLNGYPNLAFGGMYQWKRNYRKDLLTHMIRSTVIVRSPKNDIGFGILVDAAAAQSGSHAFESYLILEDEVTLDGRVSQCSANRCKIVLKSPGSEQLDVHVRTAGRELSYRVETFDEHKRLIVRSTGQTSEEFWIAFHPHEGNANGFEMLRNNDGSVQFKYEGIDRYFSVDKQDQSVVETDKKGNPKNFSSPQLQIVSEPEIEEDISDVTETSFDSVETLEEQDVEPEATPE